MTRSTLPLLRGPGAGRVVQVGSVTGAVMTMRGEVAYAAAKAGLVGLTRALAVDEASRGIAVNAVAFPASPDAGHVTSNSLAEERAARVD